MTVDNFRRRQVVVVDWRCMRKQNGETIDHLLIHGPIAQELWNMVCSLFGRIGSCHVVFNRHRTTVIWSMIPYCLMWGIWGERNTHTFEGNERSIHHLKLLFFQTLFEWATASGVPTFTSLHDLYLVFSHLFFNEVIYLSKLKKKKKKKIMNQSRLNLKTAFYYH